LPEDISALAEKSDRLFIFATTVVNFVDDKNHNPKSRLDLVLRTTAGSGLSPYKQLDKLYQQVLEHGLPASAEEVVLERFRTVMGAVTLVYDTLTVGALGCLLQMEAGEVQIALLQMHSLVIVPENEDEIRIIHPSFRDFMTQRCPEKSRYFIKPVDRHRQLVLMCFKTMHDNLKRDICRIRDMSTLNAEVQDLDSCIITFIPAHLQYACHHWATHLSELLLGTDFVDDDVSDALMGFSSLHLLHWLEVLSLLGWLADALPALRHAQDWASVSNMCFG
jgi:hypothetical protein